VEARDITDRAKTRLKKRRTRTVVTPVPRAQVLQTIAQLTAHPAHGMDTLPALSLADPLLKFRVLDGCCSQFGREIPNYDLAQLRVVEDVLRYFEVKPMPRGQATVFPSLSSGALPPNLAIQAWRPKPLPTTTTHSRRRGI